MVLAVLIVLPGVVHSAQGSTASEPSRLTTALAITASAPAIVAPAGKWWDAAVREVSGPASIGALPSLSETNLTDCFRCPLYKGTGQYTGHPRSPPSA